MVTPIGGTHYSASQNEDGTGTNYTGDLSVTASFGIADVEYRLEHTGSIDLWVQQLDAVGRGVYIDEPIAAVFEDEDSKSKHGVFTRKFDFKYQVDPTFVEKFCRTMLGQRKDPKTTVDKYAILANKDGQSMYGFLQLVPGTRATFKEDMNAIDGEYYIMGYDAELINGDYVIWTPVLRDIKDIFSSLWIWDYSNWGINTIWAHDYKEQ